MVLTSDNPDVHQWKTDLAETCLELARIETGKARLDQVLQAQAILQELNARGAVGREQLEWMEEIQAALASPAG